MATDIIISIIAEDRPGLVETVSDVVARHGGNWVDSSMARLGGEFAGIVHVCLPAEAASGFETDLSALAEDGISATLRRSTGPGAVAGVTARLDVTGADHPGIVRDISAALAARDVSIDELHTQVVPGSMSGAPVFVARGRLVLPDAVTVDAVTDALEDLAGDLMVDVTLSADR